MIVREWFVAIHVVDHVQLSVIEIGRSDAFVFGSVPFKDDGALLMRWRASCSSGVVVFIRGFFQESISSIPVRTGHPDRTADVAGRIIV